MRYKLKNRGFSLIEMGVLTLILASLFVSVFIGFSADKDISERKSVAQKLRVLKTYALRFASDNGRYLCPGPIAPNSDESFGKEAYDSSTGFCNISQLRSYDEDNKMIYADNYPVPVAADFVLGTFPCGSVGLDEDYCKDDNGSYFGYAVSNLLAKKSPCGQFIAADGSVVELPTKFKILTNYDFKKSVEENKKENVDPNVQAEFVIIYYGSKSIGSFTGNGTRIVPNKVVNNSTGKETYVGYGAALETNRDFGLDSQLDNYFIAPANSLRTPKEALDDSNKEDVNVTDLDDIVVYGKSSAIKVKTCAFCRNCDPMSANKIVEVDNFVGCADISEICKCSRNAECSVAAGECCNSNSGVCSPVYCAASCANNADCVKGSCCDVLGTKTCDESFCKSNPKCTSDSDCNAGECCNLSLNECNAAYCSGFPACCSKDSCCDSRCENHNAKLCACNADQCSDPSCPQYDVCKCNPSDPSCASGNSCKADSDCKSGECCNSSVCGLCSNPDDPEECSKDVCYDPSCSGYDKVKCVDCASDACVSDTCPNYNLCICNPSDPSCAQDNPDSCKVDADCGDGKCCITNMCSSECGSPPPQTCISKSECAPNQGCCNGVCFNISAMTNGECPTLACNPTTNPCAPGYVCCDGICEETKIETFGKTGGIAGTIGKGGGTVSLDTGVSSGSSSLSGDSSGKSGASSSSSSGSAGVLDVTISSVDVCNTCQNRADCGGDYCCNGVCSSSPCPNTCNSGSDCSDPATPYCCGNFCQAAPCSCADNGDCSSEAPNCCGGTCQVAPCFCANNGDCPTGMNCCGGDCQVGACSCTNNSDCSGATPNCCNGTCQAQTCCTNDSQCSNGQCCNTLNGQCGESYCEPSCCSTDSCCSNQCSGYDSFTCECQADSCSSNLCPDYDPCTCDGDCGGGSSTSSSSSGGGCPGQCNELTVPSSVCPNGCGSDSGSIIWENYDNSNTHPSNYVFDLNVSQGTILASGVTGGISWSFVFGGMVVHDCPDCTVSPQCGWIINNVCDVLTQDDPGNGEYDFPTPCKFGVDYSQADVVDTDINTLNQGSESCSLGIQVKKTPNSNPVWLTRGTAGVYCPNSSSSGCGTVDGFCRNSLLPHPNNPIMCTEAP